MVLLVVVMLDMVVLVLLLSTTTMTMKIVTITAFRSYSAICRLRPLDAVLSSGLCGKEGALPPVTG